MVDADRDGRAGSTRCHRLIERPASPSEPEALNKRLEDEVRTSLREAVGDHAWRTFNQRPSWQPADGEVSRHDASTEQGRWAHVVSSCQVRER
jgi:hypothetical protein